MASDVGEAVVELEQTLRVDPAAVGCILALAASDDLLFAATQRGLISVWDKALFQQRQQLVEVGDRCPLALAVMPRFDGSLLLCAPRGCIELWDLLSLTLRVRVVGFAGNIFSLVCINGRIFVGCQDTTIKSIDVERLLARLIDEAPPAQPVTVTLGQLSTWEEGVLVTTNDHRGYVYALTTTPRYLISGSGDGTVKVWEPDTLKCVATLTGHTGSVLSVAADRSFIYSGSQDKLVKVWDMETFYQTRSLMHGAEVTAVAVSAEYLITGSADSTVKVWDKAQFACKQTIDHGGAVTTILISGRMIFTACDNAIKVWNCEQHIQKKSSLLVSGGSIPLPDGPDLDEAMVEALRAFIKLRTISVDPAMKEQCWSGARFLRRLLREAGFECKLVQGAEGTNPLVLGRLGNDPAKPTLAYYGHYDVVPAVAEEGWDSDPFTMDGRDGYLYGRGVTDDKGPIIAFVFAVKQLLANAAAESATPQLPVNIVMAIEGEEENDSKGFIPAIENNLSWFKGTSVLLVSNGLWVGNRRPCLTYGLRGVVQLSLQITGAKKDLHSGIDGGLMHEPMVDLVAVLGQLMDRSGTILPPRFYDAVQPVTAEEAKLYEGFETQFSSLTFFTDKYGVEKNEALLSSSPKDLLMRRWRQPSLTIHSISGSVLGKDAGTTVIPHKVTAKLSVRIVPNQRPEEIYRMFASFLHEQFDALQSGNTLTVSKDHIGDWWLGNPFSEHYKAAERAVEKVWGVRPSYIREGGTIPITRFLEDKLGASAVHLPLGQASDAAHLPNERMRLENLLKGKRVFQHFLTELATTARCAPPREHPRATVSGAVAEHSTAECATATATESSE